MKRIFTIFMAVILTTKMFAQSPEKMSYQAVIRNNSEKLVTNQAVGMRISILHGSADGPAVYVETHTSTTNTNGLVTLEIGTGLTTGEFSSIEWTNGPYFVKTETDPAGGTNYSITGTSQILSVPYSLHAKTAERITGAITETDPAFTNSPAVSITPTDLTNINNLSGTNTGDQDLSSLATKEELEDSTAKLRSEIPDVSGFMTSYTETDPLFESSPASGITTDNIININNLSGTNTGDQDLSSFATKTALGDSTEMLRSEIPDVSVFMTSYTETDPLFESSPASGITTDNIININNLSGTNTGDQDLSSFATKTALRDSTAMLRSELPDVSGFLTSYTENDPVFISSVAGKISSGDTANWNNKLESEIQTLSNVISLNNSANGQIKDLTDPTSPQDAATKAYVDKLKARIEALEIANGFFIDERDGNQYDVVKIGEQVWMAENLKYLPVVSSPGTRSQTNPHYYVYGYNGTNVNDAKATANYATYGVLYNWVAATNGCPTGWHLPSDSEWNILINTLGVDAGGKLKETGTTNWNNPNNGASNVTGFTALPGGTLFDDGIYYYIKSTGYWWSSTAYNAWGSWYRQIVNDFADIYRFNQGKDYGISVRCVKN